MSAGTYDPFAIERPRLKLGEYGEWELGELHDARHARFKAWYTEFRTMTESEDATMKDLGRCVGELISVSCLDAEDAPEILGDLCDAEKHGDDARGLQTLKGIVEFLVGWAAGEDAAGEG